MRWLLVLAIGCGGGQTKVDIAGLHDTSTLDACARGDLGKQLAIVNDLRDSYHEMIVCGGLALDFNRAAANLLVTAAIGGKSAPDALTYQGNGTYATANGMMWLRAMKPDGTPLDFAVLDLESYFIGGKVTADFAAIARAVHSKNQIDALGDIELEVSMTGAGPGLPLLGVTQDSVATGKVKITPKQAAAALGTQVSIANRIDVKNAHGGSEVHYLLDGKPQLVKAVLDNKAVPMELTSIQATHEGTGQSIKITEWTMQFKGDGSQVLDGTIGLDVEGGAFPYSVRYTYAHALEPNIDVRCR